MLRVGQFVTWPKVGPSLNFVPRLINRGAASHDRESTPDRERSIVGSTDGSKGTAKQGEVS